MDSRFLDINRHGVLRVPVIVWVALGLLVRYWILVVAVAVSARRSGQTVLLLGDGISWTMLVLEIPALVVAFVAGRREPEAGPIVRLLWRHGRELMAFTVLANAVWTGWVLVQASYWTLWPELFLASCSLLDLAIILSMYTNPYFRQLFREFPPRATEGETTP